MMYPGVANSPETFLKENVAPEGTTLYVNDTSVLGDLPTLAVIGTDQNAETVLVKSKRSDGGLEVQRAIEGLAKKWEKATVIARNFTNYDYKQLVDNINTLNEDKADKGAIPTSLSQLAEDSTHRTVTDAEKIAWSSKLSSISGADISRAKTKGYSSASTWQYVNNSRDLEDWIGDFDQRTKENRDNLKSKIDKVSGKGLSTNDYTNSDKAKVDAIPSNPKYTDTIPDLTPYAKKSEIIKSSERTKLSNLKEQVILTETQYNALSSSQQNDSTKIYFIKK